MEEGSWKATVYQDDVKTPFDPNGILIKAIQIDIPGIANTRGAPDFLNIHLAPGGGFAIRLEKQ